MAVEYGDLVQVVDREQTVADRKAGLFYNHFRNLRGRVDRVYDDGAIAVIVDPAALSSDMIARLKRAERLIKPRWKTAGDTSPVPEPEPQPLAAADDGDTGEDDDAGDDADDDVEGDTADAADFVPAAAAAQAEPAEEGDSKTSPGLRYAIIVKAEDVEVLAHGEGAPAPVAPGERLPAGVRVTEQALKAAEETHMRKLLERAQGQKKS